MQPQLLLVTLLSLTFTTITAVPLPTALSYRDLADFSRLASHVKAVVPQMIGTGSYTERTLAALAEERCGELVAGKNCA